MPAVLRPIMNSRFLLKLLPVLATLAAPVSAATFEVKDRDFLLDGKPLQILSGEMHYPRVPRPYWEDRLKKAKAMGLNTICTYLFWNVHEPNPGQWNFEGNADFVAFIKACQKEGLYVLVRPGPYVCTEWDFGGFPGWILADPETKVRSMDPRFMKPAMAYLEKVSAMLKPHQIENGGPVLMVQVENEYGSFDSDKNFLKAHVDAIRRSGYTGTLFTADGPTDRMLQNGTLPDVTATLNFGGNAKNAFNTFEKHRPGQARMIGEFWVGWFDHWGKPHASTTAASKAGDYEWAVSNGVSSNIYMFHGGTNWGFYAGANWSGGYACDTTSYDYSAVLDEAGRPTDKFHAFREIIRKHVPSANFGPMPEPLPVIAIPEIRLTHGEPLFSTDPKSAKHVRADQPMTMESLGQSYGYVLYQTSAKGPFTGTISAPSVRDRAILMVDGVRQGTPLDRRVNRFSSSIHIPAGSHSIELLVENMGRINFSKEMLNERKGILGPVKLGDQQLGNWKQYLYPLDDAWLANHHTPAGDAADAVKLEKPVFYQGSFTLEKTGDTWLDMRKFGKGVVWINGHNLGRYWRIGAQQTLFVPGCWLKQGANEITLLETDLSNTPLTLSSVTAPIWQVNTESGRLVRKPGQEFKSAGLAPVIEGEFANGTTWQDIKLPSPATGRYFALESLDAHDGREHAAVAELIFLDVQGKEIPREAMRVVYADSEELAGDDGAAANVIDNQPTTFWHTEWKDAKPKHPHQIVLDLGGERVVSGFRYLPRGGDARQGGRIKRYRAFLSKTPFPGL